MVQHLASHTLIFPHTLFTISQLPVDITREHGCLSLIPRSVLNAWWLAQHVKCSILLSLIPRLSVDGKRPTKSLVMRLAQHVSCRILLYMRSYYILLQ